MGRVSAAMKKDNLLSIGALSKQTGVHIKSLRYYDSLGILRPAYVDPSSGYRYYNLQQIPVVGAIQLCIDLGISLKHFTEYYSESSGQLRYARLIERGTALAKEKIQTIQERLSNLEKLQAEIEHSEIGRAHVIFMVSYYLNGMGNLILRVASYLDAFSTYPFQT